MTEFCERCRRPAPEYPDYEQAGWVNVAHTEPVPGLVCPNCITGEDQSELDAWPWSTLPPTLGTTSLEEGEEER